MGSAWAAIIFLCQMFSCSLATQEPPLDNTRLDVLREGQSDSKLPSRESQSTQAAHHEMLGATTASRMIGASPLPLMCRWLSWLL